MFRSDTKDTIPDASPNSVVAAAVDQITSPIGIAIVILWLTSLVWLASFISTGNDTKPRDRVPLQKDKEHNKHHKLQDGWVTFKSLFTCRPIETGKAFFKKLPRRIWNFYIDAMLIPSYRPEWGKYKDWSYRSPDRVAKTEEQQREVHLRKDQAKLKQLEKMSPCPSPHDHAGCARVTFNINGRIFETQLRTLNRFPETLLGNSKRRAQFYDPSTDSYFFDRMPSSFEAILYFFQSGGYLRRPENIHLDMFYDDAEFFGLPQSVIANFKLEEGVAESPSEDAEMPPNLLQRKIWLLFDYPESSVQARILAICSVFVIVLSIISFCIETIPDFDPYQPERKTNTDGSVSNSIFEPSDMRDPFFFTDTICSIWFTVEYLIRFSTCPNKWDFVRSLQNIIDLVSILPYFLTLATHVTAEDSNKKGTESLSILRVVRLVRVFRIFKLSRHSRGLKILGLTLKSSMSELFLLIFFIFLGVVMFSSCIYFAEKDAGTNFSSIPQGFWFALITMTTVGYGEIVPKTVAGKIVGSLCAITGVLTIALPVPVIVSNFNYFYHQSIDEQEFNFAKLNHVDNCPYRPACGDLAEESKMRSSLDKGKTEELGEETHDKHQHELEAKMDQRKTFGDKKDLNADAISIRSNADAISIRSIR